jgi:5'-methylthioadenosine phosphorylase
VVKHAVGIMPKERKCACGSAMQFAIQTDKDKIPAATRQKLALLLDKYLGKGQEAKA